MTTNSLLLGLCSLFIAVGCKAQSTDEEAIKQVIHQYVSYGDKQDAEKLALLLDDNYRIVMNRLFGSNEVSIMPRAVYLEKIKNKEFGGDKREVTFHQLTLNQTTASIKVTLKGAKMESISIFTLVKSTDNTWQIVGELPVII